MNIKTKNLLLLLLLLLCLTGCGKNAELEEYQTNMSTFISNVSDIKSRMDSIDTASPDAVYSLLGCLDELQVQFEILSEMNVPSKFAGIESLADEASSYMTEAVLLYHEIFEAAEYDEAAADIAEENYDRAMKRLSYISSLLQGKLPDDENLIITEEEVLDFEPITESE